MVNHTLDVLGKTGTFFCIFFYFSVLTRSSILDVMHNTKYRRLDEKILTIDDSLF
ncbi:hypothetical protein DFQ00_1413 [Paenibacillus barcinonensis]|uniref:Uncharacterized protein n=1 Tax=Paenibacillus barcinonensis TaxID=198119 RepID=A0A2V4V7T3_PAEBA|nr:hypothetical protein DFQ00_1413 [Paenibacillus barcinonensis]